MPDRFNLERFISHFATISALQDSDTTFSRATLPRSMCGEHEGTPKCRLYVLREKVVRVNIV